MNRREFTGTLLGALGGLAFPLPLEGAPRLRVDGERLTEHLSALSQFGKNPEGGVSRVAYSDADREGRAYVLGLMRAAGLETSVDAAGNLIGRRAGRERGLRPLVFGSHIDSVPRGGNYDGPVGSLGAIEVARTLSEQGVRTRHPLEVVVFQNEEGGLIGSRALNGDLKSAELEHTTHSGKTIRDGTRFIGGDPDRLEAVRRNPGDVAAYLELHIEQGGTLERERVEIGVVEGIVGIHQWEVTWDGFANHAGTTPMDQRKDALLSAARFVEAVNRVVKSVPGRQVGTVGRMQAFPGAPNVIPGRAVHTLELRDLDAEKIRTLHGRLVEEAQRIARADGTTVSFKELHVNVPAPTDERVRRAIESASRELGLSTRRMPSGAGHDAQAMAVLGPVGMIFIPSVGGISHSPKELSHPQDIENGANVLLHTLLTLDRPLGR